MEQITQLSNKFAAERARSEPRCQPTPEGDQPPPYHAAFDSDSDDEDADEEDTPSCPLKLTINAANSVRGIGNMVPTSPTPMADATRLSTTILHCINQINSAQGTSKRALRVNLTVNCGITVVGDRNVVGAVGLRPKDAGGVIEGAVPVPNPNGTSGAKRKAEEDLDAQPVGKKVAVDASDS